MIQCECVAESTGTRCSRDAKPNSKFCWQHSKKCTRTLSGQSLSDITTSTQVSPRGSFATNFNKVGVLPLPSPRTRGFSVATSSSKVSGKQDNLSIRSMKSQRGISELEERYKEIREEARRQLLNSGTYQEYKEFIRSIEGNFVKVPTFQEYEDILDFAIQQFEDEHVQENSNFDDMNPRDRRQYLINVGESLGILKR